MPADDLGVQPVPLEHETDRHGAVRAINGLDGRRRRHRATKDDGPVVDLSALEHDAEEPGHEPLFSGAPLESPSSSPSTLIPPVTPGYELAAVLEELKVPPVVIGPAHARRSRIRGIRTWWRQESLARAAEKRALANAEAILRAQAIQSASAPFEKVPTTEDQAGSMRNLLILNEERFQSLGLHSDRLRDELVGIATSIADLRGLVASGVSLVEEDVVTGVTAAGLLTELQDRFETLLPALSEELGRRSEESEQRISVLLSSHAAELTARLDQAVERIGAALPATIPEEIQRIRELIPEEMERMRTIAIEGIERSQSPDGQAIERALGALPVELEKVRSASDARLELIEANAAARLEHLRAEQTEQLERIQGSSGDELSRIREEIAGISKSIRGAVVDAVRESNGNTVVLPDAVPQSSANDAEVLERRLGEVLAAMNANTDRLADALHRGLYAMELQMERYRD
jgi:Skp family chaperone for outer membrane proteins